MSDRTAIIELVETTIDAAAQEIAQEVNELIAQQLNSGIEALHDNAAAQGLDTEDEADPILAPALLWKTHKALISILADSSKGWETVFWTNLNEKYNDG